MGWHHGKCHVAVSWRWGALQQRLKSAKMLRRPGRGMAITREGWQKERYRSLLCCHWLVSCQRATCKRHVLLFWRPRSLLWTFYDSVQTGEGLGTGAETQRQIQVLVLPRVRIHSFSGHWREDIVHEVVTRMLIPQSCSVSMPTSNNRKDAQQHAEGCTKFSVSPVSMVGQKVLSLSLGCSSLRWGWTSALPLYVHSMCWNQVLDQGNTEPLAFADLLLWALCWLPSYFLTYSLIVRAWM